MELTELTVLQAASLMRQGKLSPVELTEAYLKRIERLDPVLSAFITITPETALQQAHKAEQRIRRKSAGDVSDQLIGIPLALKDLYEVKGVRTTAGSRFFSNYIPDNDAQVVRRLKSAGAVFLGKLNMHEIALGVTNQNPHYGTCRNPWALERITGGSSGGSGAALAAGLSAGSFGSDSGGSIRIPASLCGVVGLKPTYGRVSLRGVIPLSWSCDHAGPMGRCVSDVAALYAAVAGYDAQDPVSQRKPHPYPLGGLAGSVYGWRVALVQDEFHTPADREVMSAVKNAALVFESLGARVEQVDFSIARQAARANRLIVESEAAVYHRQRLAENPEGFGADVRQRLLSGAATSLVDYGLARRQQDELRREFEHFFMDYDFLLTPATPVVAPLQEGRDAVEQSRLLTRFTAAFNLTGLPALVLPCGFNSHGLPIGLQIVARPWDEARLLRAAFAYEQAAGWHTRRPAL